jgi:hypothetical protein
MRQPPVGQCVGWLWRLIFACSRPSNDAQSRSTWAESFHHSQPPDGRVPVTVHALDPATSSTFSEDQRCQVRRPLLERSVVEPGALFVGQLVGFHVGQDRDRGTVDVRLVSSRSITSRVLFGAGCECYGCGGQHISHESGHTGSGPRRRHGVEDHRRRIELELVPQGQRGDEVSRPQLFAVLSARFVERQPDRLGLTFVALHDLVVSSEVRRRHQSQAGSLRHLVPLPLGRPP